MYKKILIVSLISIMLISCQNVTRENQGVGAGVFLGSLLAYGLSQDHSDKQLAIAAGAILGGLFGQHIGKQLDERDQMFASRNMQTVLEKNPTGTKSSWNNPDSGNTGSTQITKTITTSSGTPCREFTTEIKVGGKIKQGYGTACRQDDGSWKVST